MSVLNVDLDAVNKEAVCGSTSVANNDAANAEFQGMARQYGKPLLGDGKEGIFFIADGWLFRYEPAI